jgi:mRNA export factor
MFQILANEQIRTVPIGKFEVADTRGRTGVKLTPSQDGTIAVGASADKKVHIMDIASSQTMTLEGHTSPVRAVRFVDVPSANAPIIASGSWDKTVRYWDMRQPQPIGVLELPERVYTMDTGGSVLVIGTAENQMHFVNLHNDPLKVSRSVESTLTYQTSALSVSADGSRWAVGGIDGRCVNQVVDEKDTR